MNLSLLDCLLQAVYGLNYSKLQGWELEFGCKRTVTVLQMKDNIKKAIQKEKNKRLDVYPRKQEMIYYRFPFFLFTKNKMNSNNSHHSLMLIIRISNKNFLLDQSTNQKHTSITN